MDSGWPERIEHAQTIVTVSIAGVEYSRVRYGDENDDWGAGRQPCRDCAVLAGQLQVPSCDVEQCPACGGQAIGCDCGGDRDEDPALARGGRPFSDREHAIIVARRLFTWRHTGFAPDGDAIFEVENGSTVRLPVVCGGVAEARALADARAQLEGRGP